MLQTNLEKARHDERVEKEKVNSEKDEPTEKPTVNIENKGNGHAKSADLTVPGQKFGKLN